MLFTWHTEIYFKENSIKLLVCYDVVGDRGLKVSVVIRTKDKEKYFDSLLKNLALQTMRVSEVVVADNFSSKQQLQSLMDYLEDAKRKYFQNRTIKLFPFSDNEFFSR